MLKKDLRTHYLELRNSVSAETLAQVSTDIANQALKLPVWGYSCYHIFLQSPKKNELDTLPLLNLLLGKDKEVVVPRIAPKNRLEHFLLTDHTRLKPNAWGIPEPMNGIAVPNSRIDVIFVPLLAFDLSGHRVGYGKGYYDRFLADCRADSVKIGVSLFPPTDKISDVDEYDVTLDFCLTPERIYKF
jgi:5-formyltetrahydrofolate cyclo-ligase